MQLINTPFFIALISVWFLTGEKFIVVKWDGEPEGIPAKKLTVQSLCKVQPLLLD